MITGPPSKIYDVRDILANASRTKGAATHYIKWQ
jgi:hypothetical protein